QPDRAVARGEHEKRGRKDRSRLLLRVAEEAPRPLPRSDARRRELAELGRHRLDTGGHQVQEDAALETEGRPVELVVADEPVMLVPARACEADAVDDRVCRAGERLERAEGREGDAALSVPRTGERVPARESVVHGEVLIGLPDGG